MRAREESGPATTRDMLVELASQVFATEGYASVSVRELGRRAGLTSGAIYGNFRDKADLLAEAIARQLDHPESRTVLTALLLEGAVATRTEPQIGTRLQSAIEGHIQASADDLKQRRVAEGDSAKADLDAVARLIWGLDIGLQVLTALGVSTPSEKDTADTVRRFLLGLQASDESALATPAATAGRKSSKPAKATKGATKKPKKTDR